MFDESAVGMMPPQESGVDRAAAGILHIKEG
jgi:hypothetical protein